MSGNKAGYSLKTDWDINQVCVVLNPFIQKYGKAKRSGINTFIGNYLFDKQLRNFIEVLKQQGKLRSEDGRGYVFLLFGENA